MIELTIPDSVVRLQVDKLHGVDGFGQCFMLLVKMGIYDSVPSSEVYFHFYFMTLKPYHVQSTSCALN